MTPVIGLYTKFKQLESEDPDIERYAIAGWLPDSDVEFRCCNCGCAPNEEFTDFRYIVFDIGNAHVNFVICSDDECMEELNEFMEENRVIVTGWVHHMIDSYNDNPIRSVVYDKTLICEN